MTTLYFEYTLMKNAGLIEDVVVDQNYRDKGIAKMLIQNLIEIGKEKKLEQIGLTSHPSRQAANNLYIKLGFKKRDTNVYRLTLE